jgi:hypothetical protein
MTIEQARRGAQKMLSQIAEGIDPAAERRQARQEMRALEQDKNDLKGAQDFATGKPDA